MKLRLPGTALLIILVPTAAFLLFLAYCWNSSHNHPALSADTFWHAAVRPGALSAAHAHLENNCNACHTPVRGVTAANCIVCHANNEALLQRQPTAFHANVGSCKDCHQEHQGLGHRPSQMDHAALGNIGMRQLAQNPDEMSAERETLARINRWIGAEPLEASHDTPSSLTVVERALDCTVCHGNDDRHFGLMGNDCAACHDTAAWTIPEFRHPAPSSRDCAQCHQAPPSHYMMHFQMISQKVAGKPHAKVEQCHVCHQTTSWPDIRGAGWYKHH